MHNDDDDDAASCARFLMPDLPSLSLFPFPPCLPACLPATGLCWPVQGQYGFRLALILSNANIDVLYIYVFYIDTLPSPSLPSPSPACCLYLPLCHCIALPDRKGNRQTESKNCLIYPVAFLFYLISLRTSLERVGVRGVCVIFSCSFISTSGLYWFVHTERCPLTCCKRTKCESSVYVLSLELCSPSLPISLPLSPSLPRSLSDLLSPVSISNITFVWLYFQGFISTACSSSALCSAFVNVCWRLNSLISLSAFPFTCSTWQISSKRFALSHISLYSQTFCWHALLNCLSMLSLFAVYLYLFGLHSLKA